MKILSLNTWHGGYLKEEIAEFIARMAPSLDVLCLQEMDIPIRGIIDPLLAEFTEVQSSKQADKGRYQLSVLVRKDLIVYEWGAVLHDVPNTGLGLWVAVSCNDERYVVCNYHGKPYPGVKTDDPDRLRASQTLIDFGKTRAEQHIFIGDFNLLETTTSISMFSDVGYTDLIQAYSIETTRNHHSWDAHPGSKQLHSDFAFVSDNVRIVAFEVLPDIVSDHQPLLLEIV